MIDKAKIVQLVESKLDEQMFLVDVSVSRTNKIVVLIDSFDGLTIDHCVKMSRFIEHSLDRETDDFELEVSSPGLTEDFRVKKQYVKNTGREVEVVTNDGTVLKGILKAAGEDSILVESKKHEIPEGEKKKHWITTENSIKYSNIKSAKAVIIF